MRTIIAISKNTFNQTIRDNILYGILAFGLLFLASTIALSTLSLEENIFIIKSLGLAGIYLFGLIITIFLGSSLVYSEIENKTTYILLAKPVTRTKIIIGKFLGLLMATSLAILLMASFYLIIISVNGGGLDSLSLKSILLQIFETGLIISLLIVFSTFTTPLSAIIYTVLIIYIGHFIGLLRSYASQTEGLIKNVLSLIYYVLPNLEKFNIRNSVIHNIDISFSEILMVFVYAFLYIIFLLYIASSIFNRKDL